MGSAGRQRRVEADLTSFLFLCERASLRGVERERWSVGGRATDGRDGGV